MTSQAAGDRPGSAQSREEMQSAITSHLQEAASDTPSRLSCESLGINYIVPHKTNGHARCILTLVLGFSHQSNLPGPTQASSVHSACPIAHSQHHPWTGAKKNSYPTVQSEELGPLYSSCPMDTGSNPHSVTHCSGPWSSVLTPQPACLKHGDSTCPEEALSRAPL